MKKPEAPPVVKEFKEDPKEEIKEEPKTVKEETDEIEIPNELNLGVSEETTQVSDPEVKPVPEKEERPKPIEKESFEYVSPPDFLKFGRGLVYNCKGKHWACVNKDSFIQCRQNQKHFENLNQKPECYPKNVYSNEVDCRTVQIHYINTNEKTDFCN